MSSIVKGVSRVFRKVTSSPVVMIGAAVLGIGAVVFTGGAALGLAPMATGWSGAAASITGATGATGALGSAMTGAITQAGYGAAIGAGVSAVTGGNPLQGAAMGAAGGALTGGISGAMAAPAAVAGAPPATAPPTAQPTAVGGGASVPAAVGKSIPTSGVAAPAPVTPAAAPAAAAPAAAAPSAGTGIGSFLSNNQTLIGSTLGGIGQGYMTGLAAQQQMEAEREMFARIRRSYNIGPTEARYRDDRTSRPTPGQAYGSGGIGGGARYAYDPAKGRIERSDA